MLYLIDGKRVSRAWHTVLTAARRDGVKFHLDSGRRTMREQWALYRQKGRWSPSNPAGAAYPSPIAPHIRVGRVDHALDINQLDGGANRFDAWCTKKGYPLDNTVPTEPWHKEIRGGGKALREFASRIRHHNRTHHR